MVLAMGIVKVMVVIKIMIMVLIRGDPKQIMPEDSKNLTYTKQLQCLHWYHPQGIVNCKNERITSTISLFKRYVIR
jgi:hypothetical protein